jgi:multidrug efflux pump subunit AcrA (membrane-fusion protein)
MIQKYEFFSFYRIGLARAVPPLPALTLFAVVMVGGASGCSVAEPAPVIEYRKMEVTERVPGTVYEEWVEPMYDTVHVPGQIDPAGNHYRMPHQSVVEIRHDRFDDVDYKESEKKR